MSSSDRKSSRWGAGPAPSVSDEAALDALLSEAKAREEQQRREQQSQQRRGGDRGGRGGGDDRRRREERPGKKPRRVEDDGKNDYYGPADRKLPTEEPDDDDEPVEKTHKPNFGLSGALTKDTKSGNVYKGVVLKFSEPPEARAPNAFWRFYVYKGDEQLDTLHVNRQSAYLFGRNEEIADIVLQHPSCSTQHAVLQYRALPNAEGKLHCQPYLMDLESTNGTFLNGVRIDSARYYQLKKGDVLRFGASKREYVLLAA